MTRKKKKSSFTKKLLVILWIIIKAFFKGIWWILTRILLAIGGIINFLKKKIFLKKQEMLAKAPITQAQHTPLIVKETIGGSAKNFFSTLSQRSQIVLVFGRRGSGKSVLGFRIIENVHAQTKRPCFVLGVKQSLLPSWIKEVETVEDVKDHGIILVDEGALTFSSRESMSKKNVNLGKLLAIARHKDLTLILITQNTAMIDKNILSLADTVIAKEGSLLQQQMERTAIKHLVEKADITLKKVEQQERIKYAYIFSEEFEGLIKATLPSFWTEKVSKNRK